MTYEVRCKKCDRKYYGETARNAFTRGREHETGIIKKCKNSPMHMHGVEEHGGNVRVEDFEMKVTGVYGGDATKRQISEAVQIQHARGAMLMNRQEEWRQVKLPCINLSLS